VEQPPDLVFQRGAVVGERAASPFGDAAAQRDLPGAAVEPQDAVGHLLEAEAAVVGIARALGERRRHAGRETQQKHRDRCAHESPPAPILDRLAAAASTQVDAAKISRSANYLLMVSRR